MTVDRRTFLKWGAATAAASALPTHLAGEELEYKVWQVGAFQNPQGAQTRAAELRALGIEGKIKGKVLTFNDFPGDQYTRVALATYHPPKTTKKITGIQDLFLFQDRRYIEASEKIREKIPEITPEALINLTYVVDGEVSQTDTEKKKKDIKGIVHNIMNRFFASHYSQQLRNDFHTGEELSIEGLLSPKQYNAMGKPSIRGKIQETLTSENLIKGARNAPEVERLFLVFDTIVETLKEIAANPEEDPTEGSLFYKNNQKTDGVVWDGKTVGRFTREHTGRAGDHWHYRLQDNLGNNIAKLARMAYFR